MPKKKNVLPKGASLSNLQNVEISNNAEIPTAPPEIQEKVDNLEHPEAMKPETSEPTTPMTDTSQTTKPLAESTDPQLSSDEEQPVSETGPEAQPTASAPDHPAASFQTQTMDELLGDTEEPLPGIASVTPCEGQFQKLLVHIRTRWTTSNINSQIGMLQRAGGFGDLKDWPIPDRFGLPQQIMIRLRNEKYLRELWLQVVFTRHKQGSGSHLGHGIAEAKIVTALAIFDLLDEYCPRKRIDEVMSE